MILKRISFFGFLLAFLFCFPFRVLGAENHEEAEKGLDVKEIIFEHLGDGYGWEAPFNHNARIPLPVILRAKDHKWFCFSSSELTELKEHAGADGKVESHLVPVVKTIKRDGKEYNFVIAKISSHKDKIVEIFPLSAQEQADLDKKLADARSASDADGFPVIDGYVCVDGKYYSEYRPFDISITKNVAALFIVVILVIWMVLGLANYYKKRDLRAPRKGMGFFELLVSFIYYDNIKPTLGDKAAKFAPYLLTCFFFILTMNLVGLIVIFPGGANLTGNIAVTLVLALCTFIVTNVLGTKHYWKEIFWPDVPIWLKCPLPIMQLIEVFGIFTKPAALCVRLFANMMGGHMIVITLTLLIFILAAFGPAVMGGATVVSVLFSIFMLLLDVLVSFIQAYVFTLLSTLFIASAQESHDEHEAHVHADGESHAEAESELNKEKALLSKEAAAVDFK